MTVVSAEEATKDLAALIERAVAGEEVVIACDGAPAVRLQPVRKRRPRGPKRLGVLKGQITYHEGRDDPLPEWLLDAFEGSDKGPERS